MALADVARLFGRAIRWVISRAVVGRGAGSRPASIHVDDFMKREDVTAPFAGDRQAPARYALTLLITDLALSQSTRADHGAWR